MEERQKSKDQILYLLKMQGAQTATNIAKQLGVSPMAVRQHLQILRAEKWVTYYEERRPQGRPVKLWHLTEHCSSQFPDSHADLMVDLLRGVEAVFGSSGLEKLLAERAGRQIQAYTARSVEIAEGRDWSEKVKAIANLRAQEGYMAEVISQSDDALLLVENHCPVRSAANSCHLLCSSELEVFRTLLGPTVSIQRVEHILQGDRRCAYLIKKI
ncbi:transcriptional regulator [[Phormidium ambiguum] IAM M-71]|uniref:Transcriptional regulator n=1 Tax=[Phormidium ambiguum] IAM M-71 TaxID=454136 RepID=A0A1U7IBE7_9CYAN|nr:metalloregulator ArsR/SmtB family transcription factor [Phormidium ambiguum]OKH33919.1 transcriptional regulator [Phormidium ambiguum IAM M-71]